MPASGALYWLLGPSISMGVRDGETSINTAECHDKPGDLGFSLFIEMLSLKVVFSITTFCVREPGSHHCIARSRRWCSLCP